MLGGVSISMQRQGGVRASVAEGGDAMAREPLLDMRVSGYAIGSGQVIDLRPDLRFFYTQPQF
jgi:hypothetical protein